jgi:hypothetical protein
MNYRGLEVFRRDTGISARPRFARRKPIPAQHLAVESARDRRKQPATLVWFS